MKAGTLVKVTPTPAGANIFYTDDAKTTPTKTSKPYPAKGIPITHDTTIMAIAIADGFSDSPVVTGKYTVKK